MSTPDRVRGTVPFGAVPLALPSTAHQLAARRAIDPLDAPPPAATLSVGRLLGRLAARACYAASDTVTDAVRQGDCR
ncbi:hypothetical protein [Luteimicrobium subarcticum]|uniref:Uncharacterized protein n=1 Tax=Luteimicrobium subarcticum TaxID=620910 RepID=A0A2M8WS70_9MICO|nr:hypothetical protein [Luteimicrobium subarcticum]PJI93686.1 hypothetical protein CLV34_1160 [Luteimicrobium subarcticum]